MSNRKLSDIIEKKDNKFLRRRSTKEKISHGAHQATTWVKENPFKTTGLLALGILSFNLKNAQSLLKWAGASTNVKTLKKSFQ